MHCRLQRCSPRLLEPSADPHRGMWPQVALPQLPAVRAEGEALQLEVLLVLLLPLSVEPPLGRPALVLQPAYAELGRMRAAPSSCRQHPPHLHCRCKLRVARQCPAQLLMQQLVLVRLALERGLKSCSISAGQQQRWLQLWRAGQSLVLQLQVPASRRKLQQTRARRRYWLSGVRGRQQGASEHLQPPAMKLHRLPLAQRQRQLKHRQVVPPAPCLALPSCL
mmetsp:Transcript_56705/g.103665  ORF Transcript_56705/g.103665 Transcript_56705/m.103665 type:complete len:222 (-) Transcript_56705:165-830(-)